jgi:hypothetical protein
MMPVRRKKISIFQFRTLPTGVQIRAWVMADWLHTGVIDGNKAIWTYQTLPLDKAGRTGAEVTLPKQESGEKNCGSYEAHNQRASSNALSLGLPLGHRR